MPSSTKNQSRVQKIAMELRVLSHALQPGAKLPTVATLCQQMSASPSTLAQALEVLENEKVIVRQHGVGLYVAPRIQKTIALVCDSTFFGGLALSPLWGLIVDVAQRVASEKNRNLQFHFAKRDDVVGSDLAAQIELRRVHGVLGLGLHQDATRWFLQKDIPYVSFASHTDKYESHFVFLDFEGEFLWLALHEFEVQNCRSVEYWCPVHSWKWSDCADAAEQAAYTVARHEKGWRQAVKKHTFDSAQFHFLSQKNNRLTHQEQGYEMAKKLFAKPRPEWPDGILVNDDMMTHGVLKAMRQHGVEVGRDLQIISHGNNGSPILENETQITVIEFDPREIAEAMFERLEQLMNNSDFKATPVVLSPRKRL